MIWNEYPQVSIRVLPLSLWTGSLEDPLDDAGNPIERNGENFMSPKQANPASIHDLPGPAALRAYFFPRQRITITELSRILGLSRDRIYKRIHAGRLNLRILRDEANRPVILLEDVISYLFPDLPPNPAFSEPSVPVRRRPGRPRKPAN